MGKWPPVMASARGAASAILCVSLLCCRMSRPIAGKKSWCECRCPVQPAIRCVSWQGAGESQDMEPLGVDQTVDRAEPKATTVALPSG